VIDNCHQGDWGPLIDLSPRRLGATVTYVKTTTGQPVTTIC